MYPEFGDQAIGPRRRAVFTALPDRRAMVKVAAFVAFCHAAQRIPRLQWAITARTTANSRRVRP
jgi:hypothetical protein